MFNAVPSPTEFLDVFTCNGGVSEWAVIHLPTYLQPWDPHGACNGGFFCFYTVYVQKLFALTAVTITARLQH